MKDNDLVAEPPLAAGPPLSGGTARGSLPGVTYDARPASDADDFDVRGALRHLRTSFMRHRLLISLCAIATAGLMQAYFMLYPPVYEAKVMVLAENEKDAVREDYYKLWSTFRKNDLDSDIELSTSTPVVRRVVEKLHLKYDDVYHPPLEHTLYLWEQSWIGKRYRKIKEWFFPPEPNPYEQSPELREIARTVRDFRAGAKLAPVPGSHVGNMVVHGPTPRVAEYANTLIDEFIADRRSQFAEEAREAHDALQAEVAKAEAEFNKTQAAIETFESDNALMFGLKKDEVLMGQWVELGLSISKLEAELASQETSLAVVQAELAQEPEILELSNVDQASEVKSEMRARLFELQNNLSQTLTRLRADSPEVRELKTMIAETQAAIAAEPDKRSHATTRTRNQNHMKLHQTVQSLQKSIAGTKAELQSRRAAYAKLGEQLAALPKLKRETTGLQQDLNASGIRLKLLRERLMMAEVSLATAQSAPSSIRVVDYAVAPSKPDWPKKKLFMVVAILIGTLIGIGIALFLDMVADIATRHRLAVRQDLPVFGTIGLDDPRKPRAAADERRAPGSRRRAVERLKGL